MAKTGEVPGYIAGGSLSFYNGSLYLFGYPWPSASYLPNFNALYAYDLHLQQWSIVETGPLRPEYRNFHSSFVYNDNLYIAYGVIMETSKCQDTIWGFNFYTKQWKIIPNTIEECFFNSNMVQDGPIVYSVFGRSSTQSLNSVFYFNISDTTFKESTLSWDWDSPKKRKNHCHPLWRFDLHYRWQFNNRRD